MDLHKTLRALRLGKGWTLKETSKRIGLSLSYISNVEKGWRNPSLEALANFAKVYGVATDYLLGLYEGERTKAALAAKYAWLLESLDQLPQDKQIEVMNYCRYLSEKIKKKRVGQTH